jgi:hypothetical protein
LLLLDSRRKGLSLGLSPLQQHSHMSGDRKLTHEVLVVVKLTRRAAVSSSTCCRVPVSHRQQAAIPHTQVILHSHQRGLPDTELWRLASSPPGPPPLPLRRLLTERRLVCDTLRLPRRAASTAPAPAAKRLKLIRAQLTVASHPGVLVSQCGFVAGIQTMP